MIKRKLTQFVVGIAATIILSNYAKAQVWCPSGATWYYSEHGEFDLWDGYSKYMYTNDTIINGITCKKLTHFYKVNGKSGLTQKYLDPEFVYSENGVTYQYNNGKHLGKIKFDTVFNINAKIGDKWRLPQVDTLCPDSMYCMKVINIGTKKINGFDLKWLYVKIGAIDMGGTKFYVFDTITERLGLFVDGFLHRCNPGFTESSQYILRCYSDDSFGSYSTGISKTCDYVTGIIEAKRDKIELSFYPNPANEKWNVVFQSNFNNNINLKIYDLTGRLVRSVEFNRSTEIPMSDLTEGIYTFTCISVGNFINSGKLSVIH